MQRIYNIIISGIIFHVEEEGYKLLQNYLEPLLNRSGNSGLELESKIAEYLLFKLKNGNTNTTVQDVESLMEFIGPIPENFNKRKYDDYNGGHMVGKKELFPFIRPVKEKVSLFGYRFQVS